MADELPPAVAKFVADISKWVGPLEDAKASVNEWKDAVDSATADAGKSIDDNVTKSVENLDRSVGDAAEDVGKDIGDKLGDSITTETASKLDEGKDKVADSASRVGIHSAEAFVRDFSERLSNLGSHIFGGGGGEGGGGGGGFFSNLLSGIGPDILGLGEKIKPMLTPMIMAFAAAFTVLPAMAGIAATGIGVALIGGLVAVGAALNTKVKTAFEGVGKTAESTIETAFKPLVPVFLQIAKAADQLMKAIGPDLSAVFKAIGPTLMPIFNQVAAIIKQLMDIMKEAAPAFGPFITAILSIVRNLLSGLMPAIRALLPLIGNMGSMGKALGQFFADAAPAMKASVTVLHAFSNIIDVLLPVLMKFAGVVDTGLVPVINGLGAGIKDLMPAFSIIAKLVGALASAMLSDLVGAFGSLAQLVQAISPGLAAFAKALSSIFVVLENAGVFAILGDAVEALIKPLGTLVNSILKTLAPLLPPIIKLISQLASEGIMLLVAAVVALLPSLTQLVNTGLKTLTDILPVIVPLLSDFAKILTPVLAGVIQGIATALNAIITAIPPSILADIVMGIIALVAAIKAWDVVMAITAAVDAASGFTEIMVAIALLVVGIIELVKHWHDVEEGAKIAFDAVKRVVMDVVNWIEGHWKLLLAILLGPFGLLVDFIVDNFKHIENAVSDVIKWIETHWKLLVAIILGPLGLIIDALVTHWSAVKHGFEDAWNFVYNNVIGPIISVLKSIIEGYISYTEDIFKVGWNIVKTVVLTIWSWIVDYIKLQVDIVKTVLSWFEKLGDLFRGWWDDVTRAIEEKWGVAIAFIKRIPSDINNALGGLPAMMFKAGVHIIESLLDGVKSMFGEIGNVIGSVASKVAGFFGLSPAKEGPLSGSGAPFIRGLHFALDLAQGIEAGRIAAASAAARLTASITNAVSGSTSLGSIQSQARYTGGVAAASPAAAGGAPGGDLVIQVDGQRLFTIMQSQLYRYNVRNSGVATGVLKPA